HYQAYTQIGRWYTHRTCACLGVAHEIGDQAVVRTGDHPYSTVFRGGQDLVAFLVHVPADMAGVSPFPNVTAQIQNSRRVAAERTERARERVCGSLALGFERILRQPTLSRVIGIVRPVEVKAQVFLE